MDTELKLCRQLVIRGKVKERLVVGRMKQFEKLRIRRRAFRIMGDRWSFIVKVAYGSVGGKGQSEVEGRLDVPTGT
jgi:hypothetical protein